MASWCAHPTAVLYLTAGQSTEFAVVGFRNVQISNVYYPDSWSNLYPWSLAVNPGDVVFFTGNRIHAAPPARQGRVAVYFNLRASSDVSTEKTVFSDNHAASLRVHRGNLRLFGW